MSFAVSHKRKHSQPIAAGTDASTEPNQNSQTKRLKSVATRTPSPSASSSSSASGLASTTVVAVAASAASAAAVAAQSAMPPLPSPKVPKIVNISKKFTILKCSAKCWSAFLSLHDWSSSRQICKAIEFELSPKMFKSEKLAPYFSTILTSTILMYQRESFVALNIRFKEKSSKDDQFTQDFEYYESDTTKREENWKNEADLLIQEASTITTLDAAKAKMAQYTMTLADRLLSHDHNEKNLDAVYGGAAAAGLPAPIVANLKVVKQKIKNKAPE